MTDEERQEHTQEEKQDGTVEEVTGQDDKDVAEVEDTEQDQEEEESEEEEETEIEREQRQHREHYTKEIEKLDDIIADYQATKLDDMKRSKLKEAKYSDEQADRYLSFINGNTAQEIEQSIRQLSQDIPPNKSKYVDPSAQNGARQTAKTGKGEQLRQMGQALARRLKRGR